jgi:hypothetical protein
MAVWLRGPRCVSLEQENILRKERSGRLLGRKEVETVVEELATRREGQAEDHQAAHGRPSKRGEAHGGQRPCERFC